MKTWQNVLKATKESKLDQTFYNFSKNISETEKFEKVLERLSEKFPHISTTNFDVLFSSENFKRENGNFRKYLAYFFLLPLISRFFYI